MGDDSLILRDDGFINVLHSVKAITYHNNLNVILVRTTTRAVLVVDVNSGVILQSTCLGADSGGVSGLTYAPGADRVFAWDGSGVTARTDYNGVLLLHTALQLPLQNPKQKQKIKLELILSEAVLLLKSLENLAGETQEGPTIEGLSSIIQELETVISREKPRKSVKAQKWTTVTIELPHSLLRSATQGIVQELIDRTKRIPALAIASAIGQRTNELVPCSQDDEPRSLMYSEAERKQTFKRWPHMDYKWALPARMAQAGFYHQPSPNGDDRAMCFICLVCLVCWEKSDEPWVEHERHSPSCPFVRGEYTHNVPISVTNATACGVSSPNVTIVSKNNNGDLIASGTADGKVNIWKFDCGIKLYKYINITAYDSIFSGMLCSDTHTVWTDSLDKDPCTYAIELTAMAFLGTSAVTIKNQTPGMEDNEPATFETKPTLICGVVITRTGADTPADADHAAGKELFEGADPVRARNQHNTRHARRMLFLIAYDMRPAGSAPDTKPGTKKSARVDGNIYDEMCALDSDDDTTSIVCTNLIEEHFSKVIELNAPPGKDHDITVWDPKKFIKHLKAAQQPMPALADIPEVAPASMLDFADKIAQLKTWASSNLSSAGKTDAVDSALDEMDPITHYLNLNGPIVSDFKCYEPGTDAAPGDKAPGAKLGTQTVAADNNNHRYDPAPAPEDVPAPASAVHCLRLPHLPRLLPDARVTHILPLEDKARLLVVVAAPETEPNRDSMDVDEEAAARSAYVLVYRVHPAGAVEAIDDAPLDVHELPANEAPADLCRVPALGDDDYSLATAGADGVLRVYSFPGMRRAEERTCPRGRYTSVSYCLGAERLGAGTSDGAVRFYGVGRGPERTTDPDDDEPATVPGDPGGPDPSAAELRHLAAIAGAYGANVAVPYSAVVPGFWCELSAAQRARRDRPAERVWRLQNASSAWDEHALELTLPRSASLAHVDFGFSLHAACAAGRPPAVRVSLLKQGAAGLAFGDGEAREECGRPDAEVLAGPLELAAGLDISRESGALVLTSPRLYRARGRTFLVHVQTVREPEDSADDGEERSAFVGCDWIHQITITVRTSPRPEEPADRARRVAMLESDSFLRTLLRVAAGRDGGERRSVALDLLVWVLSVRLQRLRLASSRKDEPDALLPGEAEQVACVNIVETFVKDLIKNCILCAKRSLAKKCVKILLITNEGEKQLPNPSRVTFGVRLRECLRTALPLLGACESPGAMRWFLALASKVLDPNVLLPSALQLLEKLSRVHHTRDNLHHRLLRARFGLYGLPLERQIFEVEGPDLSKSTIPVLTFNSVLSGETSPSSIPKPDCKLKNLYNFAGDNEKACPAGVAWWTEHQGLAALCAGLSEVQALHVSCHVASDGTKLEAARQPAPLFCTDPELWASLKEGQVKVLSNDQVSLDDADNSSIMDCDSKIDLPDENIFKEQESCSVPWAQLVMRPPLHNLLVERMHSGARRYVILDFGHPVRLTDVVIPSCADLVTLGVDIWLQDEEKDNVKLAYAMDIATKHLVLTDIQPPPICRYMKITTIGRYGMSAMKCKIPLGWFYGEVAQISNVPSSISALRVLYEDLTCKFRLATGKLIDLLNPFLDLYYGNVSHMMAYFNTQTENDPKVTAAYHECIDIQQQLHFVHIALKKLQSDKECDDKLIDFVAQDNITSEMLLERACTDKLRVMIENVVDLALHLYFEKSDASHEVTSASWCAEVSPLLWSSSARTAASLAALLPRLCARASWWGAHLANTLHGAFTPHDDGPRPLHRILVLTMYMCRRNPAAAAPALAEQLLTLLAEDATPALTAAVLAALSAAFDTHHSRWEWVVGGRPVSMVSAQALAPTDGSPRADSKPHRRKLHKKLIYQMQELENARREAQVVLEERTRGSMSCRLPNRAPIPLPAPPRPLVPRPTARALGLALTRYMLRATHQDHADTLMLCAKVIGRLCLTAGGPSLLDAPCIQGLVRLAVTLPPWPRHAAINLIQDIIESDTLTQDEARAPPFCRPRKAEEATSASISQWKILRKARNALSGRTLLCHILKHHEEELKGGESDDSDGECKTPNPIRWVKKEDSFGEKIDLNNTSLPGNISSCGDARLETCTEAWSETLARSLLVSGCDALATAVRSAVTSADSDVTTPSPPTEATTFSLPHTFVDVFRCLSVEFAYQGDSTFLENVLNLWLIMNGSPWGFGRTGNNSWVGGLMTVVEVPKVRIPTDVVEAILSSLVNLDQVTLRCWILCLQTFAWISNQQNLDQPGSSMGEAILKSDNFVPAIIKFINMNIASDGAVFGSEAFLSGVTNGAGAGAASTLYVMLSRVLSGRGVTAAGVVLQIVAGVSDQAAPDLRHALLRSALPLAPLLSAAHAPRAAALIRAVANECGSWISSVCDRSWGGASGPRSTMDAAGDVRLGELLADGCARRHGQRRQARVQLLRYCMALLSVPSDAPTPSTSASQTDESKQQAQRYETNADDEHKQQAAAKPPCVADTILQQPHVMCKLFKALSLCENRNSPHLLNSNPESTVDTLSLKDEIYWLVAQIGEAAAQPDLLVITLLDYLRADPSIYLSESLQNLITRLLQKPHFHNLFIERGGLEIAIDKMVAYHDNQPTTTPGLISSLMNYLKLPVLVPPTNNTTQPGKKSQSVTVETANGLYNYAPLCTITCDNPTAQVAEVLLGAGPGSAAATAARRVRSAAWSYHFFTADDTSLALLLTLPHAIMLHELQLQPHLTSLATCPGAVALEAGCFGALTPLGPPQNTAGLSFIRLVLAQPIVCTHVQVRLYKPRDSSNMGLLQLRLLGSPAFSKTAITAASQNQTCANRWACIVSGAVSRGVCASRWAGVIGGARALAGLVLAGGAEASHAYHALLAAATASPAARPAAVEALLKLDAAAHAHAFQSRGTRNAIASSTICELLQRICVTCCDGSVQAYLRWFTDVAERYLRTHAPPSAALVQTLASILWTLKERNSLDKLDQLINDEMFELLFTWLSEVPDNSILKRALDAVLCSMCYIRPELFRSLLEQLYIPTGPVDDEIMEGVTDDGKVEAVPAPWIPSAAELAAARGLQRWQLGSVAAAAMSPAATPVLLRSPLLPAAVHLHREFCIRKLEEIKRENSATDQDANMSNCDTLPQLNDPELQSIKSVCIYVEWMRMLCADRRLKDWIGTHGVDFWKPLLMLLCYPRPNDSTWQEGQLFEELEENTIRLFAELTMCHPENQKLFASTLHSVLETLHKTESVGISGFTRALILRLLLTAERCSVSVQWEGAACSPAGTPGQHPALPQAPHVMPAHTTITSLLRDRRAQQDPSKISPTICLMSSTLGSGVLRSASDTAVGAGSWELSLAAGSASKDRRAKDVKGPVSCLKGQYGKKKLPKSNSDANTQTQELRGLRAQLLGSSPTDSEPCIVVRVAGLNGAVPHTATLAQLAAAVPPTFGPHLRLTLARPLAPTTLIPPPLANIATSEGSTEGGSSVLREFGACGGLALVAARLPRPSPVPVPVVTLQLPPPHTEPDWVKLEDFYDEVLDLNDSHNEAAAANAVPGHALVALAMLLKLPGYAAALLDEGPRAVHLLRLLLGVGHDEDGRSISVNSGGSSLGSLPFLVVARLLQSSARGSDDGRTLRRMLLGVMRLVLACLAVFTHHRPDKPANQGESGAKPEEKSQLYWAKGTGFGTGSTQQSWNVEQALHRQKTEEEYVTVLLLVVSSYIDPALQWPPEEESEEPVPTADAEPDLPEEFVELLAASTLVPAICSYLRNDSVLDMSRHIPLYLSVLSCARALFSLRSRRMQTALAPLPRLLRQMSTTTASYATKLRMNKKDIIMKLSQYHKKLTTVRSSEQHEEDEGLATLIADIQATSKLMSEQMTEEDSLVSVNRPLTAASREARYIEVMKKLQFESFEMMEECTENVYRFKVPYHFESTVRAAGDRSHPTRMKRLAQEAATLASSLPLSFSSSVFVRTDTDRLDVMKVLITGPSDTPYANGCFVLDVYFPAEYPAVPMMVNLDTTGRHSVRFNPNLYNDGKVCLSVLNTWHGRPEEKWNAHTSSFLQVLVSIQSLILVPEPYFNEPGYERSRGTRAGNNSSTEYNSNIYQANVRWAMLDHLRHPEPCFKEVIQKHFWIKRNEIMQTISNWITELEAQTGDDRTQRTIQLNLMALKRHYVKIQEELAKLPIPAGLEDMDEPFQLPAAPAPPGGEQAATTVVDLTTDMDETSAQLMEEIYHDMEKIVSQVLE